MLSTDYKLQQDTPGHKGFISDSTMSEYVIPSKPMEINISKSPVLKNDYLKNENPSELDIIIVDDNSNLQKRKSVSSAPQIYQLSEESNKTVSTKRFKVADSLSKSKPAKDIPNKSQHISSITSPTPVPNNAAEKYTTPLLGYSTSAESVFACSNPPAAIRQKIESLFTAFSFNEVRLVENLVTFLTSISEKHWKSEQDYFNVAISECIVYGIRDSFWRKISRNSSIIARIRNYLVSKIKEKNFLETEPVIRVLAKMSISKTVLDNFKLEKPLLLLDKKGDPSIKRLIKHILDFAQGPEISSDDESLDELQPNMKMDRPTIPVVLAQPVKRTAQAIPNPTVANTSPITASAPASKLVDKGNISIKSPSQPLLAINNTKPVTKKIVSGPPQTGNKGFFNKFGKSSTLLAGTTSSSTPNLSISAPSFKSTDSALYKPPVTLYKSPTPAVKTPTAPAARFSLGSTLDKLRASKTSTKPVTSDSSATTETVKVSKKKTVRFKSDKDLVEVRVFYKDADPDHTHTRNLKEARDLDREEVKSFNYHDAEEEEDLEYRPPISIQFNFNSSNSNMFGRGGSIQADSPEKKLQIDRESSVLVAIYSDDSDIPYSPAEPKAGDQDKAAANSCKKMIVPYELSHNVRYAEKFSQTNVDMSSDISKPTNWNSGNEVTGNNNLANLTSILNSLTRNSVTPSLQELYPTVALNNYSNNNREVPEPGYYNGPPQSDQVIPNLNQRPVSMGSDNALSNILRQLAQSSGGDAGSGGYQGNGMVMNDYSNQKTNYEYDNDRNNLQLNSVYTKASNDHRSRYADSPHPPSSEIIDLRLRDARPLVVSTATTQDMTKWTSLCKFFPLKKGCWRGDSCIYLHVRDNNY
ncbi:hypothetical protein NADFUDRAFT_84379 [Nadsonia fulvescens var. elongata DSM 6958]|uniref:C3H1-type domain-containing protein n=1 Tax=Nadsonia fulvescens var. elongata DSM 6958 TaxID=857566 RepID=A0A1E3PD96_9ASCO|nr:hypothetical protein NADFUDRAFT_84379 [Nadsonia fulvescens var. elongata DSM 6958]